MNGAYIRWFRDISLSDLPSVGGKNAALGEMYRSLGQHGIPVPNGFAVTAGAYRDFLRHNDLASAIQKCLDGLVLADIEDLSTRARTCRGLLMSAELPASLIKQIQLAYHELKEECGTDCRVAARSSATAEDLPTASFAGLQETFLNIGDEGTLLEACKKCFASLFTERAISYREERGFEHLQVALSIGIQVMVRSDLASSGVMFTIDTETGFPNVLLINSTYGLGENIVKGAVNPDEFLVFKPTVQKGLSPILRRTIGSKETKLVYATSQREAFETVPVSLEDRSRLSLSDEDVLTLARWGCKIEEHFSQLAGKFTPMDIEWAKDGITGQLFILQARPETVHAGREVSEHSHYVIRSRPAALLSGSAVGRSIAHGFARVIRSTAELKDVQKGDILVSSRTEPDWEPAMKVATAIVTDHGGRTCHAAILSRELGIPAVVGTRNATTTLTTGQEISVSCVEGERGFVYSGKLDFERQKIHLGDLPITRTKLMLNMSDPSQALNLASFPAHGVGLMRMEFIISSHIGVHPLALLEPGRISDRSQLQEIDERTRAFPDKSSYFVDKLAEGIGTIAAAFFPRETIIRFSDFKTNEYARLLGGEAFEPKEENPMLGFRGASRYYHEAYRRGFALECAAILKVRNEMGLTNVKVMVPFCRTVQEARAVLDEMERNKIGRDSGVEIYMMCEIPSNVLLAPEFLELFDGYSIGSNDLTQLILGIDRDCEEVAPLFDERNPAVKDMISSVIQEAKKRGKHIGICGQAPSDFPEFAQFLVEEGIDSIPLNPDSFIETLLLVHKVEQNLNARAA